VHVKEGKEWKTTGQRDKAVQDPATAVGGRQARKKERQENAKKSKTVERKTTGGKAKKIGEKESSETSSSDETESSSDSAEPQKYSLELENSDLVPKERTRKICKTCGGGYGWYPNSEDKRRKEAKDAWKYQ